MDSQGLDDSMLNIIERAEAFLSSHSAQLSRRAQSHNHQEETQSPDNRTSSETGVESSSVSLPSASSSASNLNEANHSQQGSSLLSSIASGSSSGLSHSSEVHLLYEDSEDSDDSGSTVSYEIHLPNAVPYGWVQPVVADQEAEDSVIIVAATVPTIDLCSPPTCDDLSMLSPRSRRNRRRRIAANAPIIDSITLDDTEPDRPSGIISQSTSNAFNKTVTSGQPITNPTEQHAKRARGTISTEPDTPTKTVICPICFDSIFNKKAASTICGHLFCFTCITHEFAIRKQCPICKRKLARAHIHPIYFN